MLSQQTIQRLIVPIPWGNWPSCFSKRYRL